MSIAELQGAGRNLLSRFLTTDASVSGYLQRLSQGAAQIGAEDLLGLFKAAGDYGQLSRQEWAQIYQWAQQSWQRLSPEAHTLFAKVDAAIQAGGGGVPLPGDSHNLFGKRASEAVLSGAQLEGLVKELEVLASASGTMTSAPLGSPTPQTLDLVSAGRDESAARAVDKILNQLGLIGGEALVDGILDGAGDLDNQAAGVEFAAFQWLQQVAGDRFSPAATEVMEIYQQHAARARAAGQTGIPADEFKQMIADMKAAVRRHSAGEMTASETADRAATRAKGQTNSSSSSAAGAGKGSSMAERAASAAQSVSDLMQQIQELDPKSKTYQADLIKLQMQLQHAQEQLKMYTEMLKSIHQMNMDVIRNLKV